MISAKPHGGLKRAIEQVVRSMDEAMAGRHIHWTIDCDPCLPLPVTEDEMRRALIGLIQLAVCRMPHGGELDVIAVATSRGIEIEVADSGPTPVIRAAEALDYLPRRRALPAGSFLEYDACPQGGWAVTWVIPRCERLSAAA